MEEKKKTATLFLDDKDSSRRVREAFRGLEEEVEIIQTEDSKCADFKLPHLINDWADQVFKEEEILDWAHYKKKELAQKAFEKQREVEIREDFLKEEERISLPAFIVTFYQPKYWHGEYGATGRGHVTIRKTIKEHGVNDGNIRKHVQWMLDQINETLGSGSKKFIIVSVQKIVGVDDVSLN